jgi:hypothetical protein
MNIKQQIAFYEDALRKLDVKIASTSNKEDIETLKLKRAEYRTRLANLVKKSAGVSDLDSVLYKDDADSEVDDFVDKDDTNESDTEDAISDIDDDSTSEETSDEDEDEFEDEFDKEVVPELEGETEDTDVDDTLADAIANFLEQEFGGRSIDEAVSALRNESTEESEADDDDLDDDIDDDDLDDDIDDDDLDDDIDDDDLDDDDDKPEKDDKLSENEDNTNLEDNSEDIEDDITEDDSDNDITETGFPAKVDKDDDTMVYKNNAVSVKLRKNNNKNKTAWIVSIKGKPVMKVFAGKAWHNLAAAPLPGSSPLSLLHITMLFVAIFTEMLLKKVLLLRVLKKRP